MLKPIEQAFFRFIYKKKVVRNAERWSENLVILIGASTISCVLYFWKPFDAWAERDRRTQAPFAQNSTPYKLTE